MEERKKIIMEIIHNVIFFNEECCEEFLRKISHL